MTRLAIPVGSQDHIQGQARAAVTLVEYGDYECRYCGEAYPSSMPYSARWVTSCASFSGTFPLAELHPHAVRERLNLQRPRLGKASSGRPMICFTKTRPPYAMPISTLMAFASVSIPRSLPKGSVAASIPRSREDFTGGIRSGVNGTPSLFINGFRMMASAMSTAARLRTEAGRPDAIHARAGSHR